MNPVEHLDAVAAAVLRETPGPDWYELNQQTRDRIRAAAIGYVRDRDLDQNRRAVVAEVNAKAAKHRLQYWRDAVEALERRAVAAERSAEAAHRVLPTATAHALEVCPAAHNALTITAGKAATVALTYEARATRAEDRHRRATGRVRELTLALRDMEKRNDVLAAALDAAAWRRAPAQPRTRGRRAITALLRKIGGAA